MTDAIKKDAIIIGAGSHAEMVLPILAAQDFRLLGYVDPRANSAWEAKGIKRIEEARVSANFSERVSLVLGFVGLDSKALARRLSVFREYQSSGMSFPAIQHPKAIVDSSAIIGHGAQIMPGAIINPQARIGEASVINSGAIIEHGATIGAGVHIGPGAIVLGNATICDCAFIGAGAVVVQNTNVPAETFVRALSIHK